MTATPGALWWRCTLVAAALLAACGDGAQHRAAAAAPPVPAAAPAPGQSAAAAASAALWAPAAQADREAPALVPPVVHNGVRYAQAEDGRVHGFNQVGGVLVATAADSGRQLWVLQVYANPVDPAQEADAQWVFFQAMALGADGRLRIVDEAGRVHLVDLARRTVAPGR